MPVMFVAFYLGRKCTNSDIHLNTEEIFMVKEERERRAWSQEDLAEMSGVSVRTIQRLEGGSRASLETLKCLAAVFSITVEELNGKIVNTIRVCKFITVDKNNIKNLLFCFAALYLQSLTYDIIQTIDLEISFNLSTKFI